MNGGNGPSGVMGSPGAVSGSVPVPDPTKLTTDAVNTAAKEWGERLSAQRELFDVRLAAMDRATELVAERVQDAINLVTTQMRHAAEDRHSELQGLKDVIGERIDGIDRASTLLAKTVDKIPSDLDRAVAALREILLAELKRAEEVTDQRFRAIDGTFASNALALTAALAAQKEAAAESVKSSTLAIDRANAATKETILANQAQTAAGLGSQAATMSDLKDRVVRIESMGVGAAGQRSEQRQGDQFTQTDRIAAQATFKANISLIIGAVGTLVAFIAVLYAIAHASH